MTIKTTVIWGCTGADTTELSFRLGKAEAEKGKTLVVELPCLGIPRLGFSANIMDRVRNVEAMIIKTEHKIPLKWEMIYPMDEHLGVLAASVFATPDCPIISKVNLSTLMEFAQCIKNFAEKEKCRHLIFDCQGQLMNPMTFFALKAADCVVIPIGKPTDAAYVLSNVRRLVDTFKYPAEKFILLVEGDARAIKRIATIKGEDGKQIQGIKILSCGQALFDQTPENTVSNECLWRDPEDESGEQRNLWDPEKNRPRRNPNEPSQCNHVAETPLSFFQL